MACYSSEGIDAVKEALKFGLTLSTENQQIKVYFEPNIIFLTKQINLIAPPLYVVTTVSLDKELGIVLLGEVLEKIKSKITEKDGVFNVKLPVNHVCLQVRRLT